tara:strand:- start:149 stop:253 length:105 start_codon:yes stop_codon:yes gene_type:complete
MKRFKKLGHEFTHEINWNTKLKKYKDTGLKLAKR